MHDFKNRGGLTAVVLSFVLAACGGGGGGGSSEGPKAEGVYGGTLTGSVNDAFELVVLENDEFWAIYGDDLPAGFFVAGFIQGNGLSRNGSFNSSNARDFGFAPPIEGTVSATYDATAKTIAGQISNSSGAIQFQGGPIPGSLYNYETPADISKISGSWVMQDLTGENLTLEVAPDGSFTGITSSDGCTLSGSFSPRASGRNVFDVSLTFGPAPCALPGQTATGIGIEYPLASGETQLLTTVIDSTRQLGTVAFGTR